MRMRRCCLGVLFWLIASAGSMAVAQSLNMRLFSAEDRHWAAQQSLTSLTHMQTDDQRQEDFDSDAPSWTTLRQYYADELMTLALMAAFIIWFAWRARAAQRRAMRDAQAKTDFLSVMSHEIRTPMHAILSAVELLRRSRLDRRQQELITVAGSAADALLGLLDDVLDASRLDARRLDLAPVPTDMVALVEDAIRVAGIKADEKGLPILLESQMPGNTDVGVDPTRMRHVVSNLLSNAVKFTERGSVSVDLCLLAAANASSTTSQLQVTVRDTGIGISAEQQGRLFSPYTQADAATTRRYGGSGLGLTICQQVIALMQGTLVLQSEVGRGTSIRCTIPVTTHARQCTGPEPADHLRPLTASSALSAERSAPTIMIVDDHDRRS